MPIDAQGPAVANAIADMVFCIGGPILTYDEAWGKTTPKWMLQEVQMSRLAQRLKKEKGKATDEEVAVYLYSASMVAPMSHEWANIYLYFSGKMAARKYPDKVEEIKKLGPEALGTHEKVLLADLRRWLWNRNEQAKREMKKGFVTAQPKPGDQLKLFDE